MGIRKLKKAFPYFKFGKREKGSTKVIVATNGNLELRFDYFASLRDKQTRETIREKRFAATLKYTDPVTRNFVFLVRTRHKETEEEAIAEVHSVISLLTENVEEAFLGD